MHLSQMLPAATYANVRESHLDLGGPDATLYSALLIQDGCELYEAHTAVIAFGARGSFVLRDRCEAAAKLAPGLRLRIDITDLNLDVLAVGGILEWMHGETPSILGRMVPLQKDHDHVSPVQEPLDLQQVCELEKAATALGVLSLVREIHERLLLLSRTDFNKAHNPLEAYDAVARIISEGKRSIMCVLHHYLERNVGTISDHDKLLLRNAVKASNAEQKGTHAIKNRWQRVRRLSEMVEQRNAAAKAKVVEDYSVTVGRARCGFDAGIMGDADAAFCSIKAKDEFEIIYYRDGDEWCGIQLNNGERGYVPTYAVEIRETILNEDMKEDGDGKKGENGEREKALNTNGTLTSPKRHNRRSLRMAPARGDDITAHDSWS